MGKVCRRVAGVLDYLKAIPALGVLWSFSGEHPYSAACFLSFMVLSIAVLVLDPSRIGEGFAKAKNYLVDLKSKQKDNRPWIMSLVWLNLSFFVLTIPLISTVPDAYERTELLDMGWLLLIVMNVGVAIHGCWRSRERAQGKA